MIKLMFAILTLIFINGCSSSPTSVESIELEDITGVWEMTSSMMDISMGIDMIQLIFFGFDEDDCLGTGGNYNNGGCTLSDNMMQSLGSLTCQQLNGIFSNNTCSSITQSMTTCCSESESATYTINLDGSISVLAVDNEGETTVSGNISLDGSNIMMTMDNQPSMTGEITLSGDTMTLEFLAGEEILASLDISEMDENYSNAISSLSIIVTMVMERI